MNDDADVWQQERELAELYDAADALEAANRCPKCGACCDTNHSFYMGIETFVRFCTDCDWEGKPE